MLQSVAAATNPSKWGSLLIPFLTSGTLLAQGLEPGLYPGSCLGKEVTRARSKAKTQALERALFH